MTRMTAWGHVLVAEDDPVIQTVERAMLEHLGYHVDVVTDGLAAVEAAATRPYRAILLDCQLPVLDGYLVASEIRRWRGASRHAPIIAVTASATDAERTRCRTAGMEGFLVKPLNTADLSDCLARWAPDEPIVKAFDPLDEDADVSDADEPALDPAIVERLQRLGDSTGEDLMGQLAELFLADADAHIAEMGDCLRANDVAAVLRSAHTLSGASGNLGARHLAELFSTFAIEGVAGNPIQGATLIAAIETELARVRIALDARTTTS